MASPGVLIVMKLVALLLLVVAAGCFGYGAWRGADEIVFRATSVPVQGEVVATVDRKEARTSPGADEHRQSTYTIEVPHPVIRFRSPVDGRLHRVVSTRSQQDGEEVGARVELRASTREARDGRPPYFAGRVVLPAVLVLGGLLGIVIVVLNWSLLLVEGPGPGLVLPALRPVPVIAVLALLPAALRWTIPERSERVVGLLVCDPPSLAAAMRAEPPGPGQLLSRTELRLARLPVYGRRAATAVVELAIDERRHEDLRRYLRAHRDPALRFPIDLDDLQAFSSAVHQHDADAVRILLEAGLDARKEERLLQDAVWTHHGELLRLLAGNGVAPADAAAAKDLVHAALVAGDDMLLTVLEVGWIRGEPFPPSQRSLLDRALVAGLVRSSAELERRGFATTSPLLARLTRGDLAGMRALLPEAQWAEQQIGDVPLLVYAARAGQLAVVRRLVELGSDPAARAVVETYPEKTALGFAAERGHLGVVRYLAALPGAQRYVSPERGRGESPVILAAKAQRWDAVQALVSAGATPNVRKEGREDGETPLHYAASQGEAAAAAWLLAHGADPLAEAGEKVLPVELAEDPATRAAIERAGGRGP